MVPRRSRNKRQRTGKSPPKTEKVPQSGRGARHPRGPANSRVRAKLLRGEPVRFDAKKQTEKQREVPAQWVAEALREGHRVELVNAILTGPLDLQSAHVEQEFILFGCEVRGPVNAIYARFARWVLFGAVRFHDSVSFKGARFAAELNCTGAHFLKGVTFDDSIIEGSFVSPGAEFGSSEEDPVGFNGCEIRCAANFILAVFHGPAQFISLIVGGQASFGGVRFRQGATFDGAQIGGNFFFRAENEQRVEFGGEARFHGVKVGGEANFGGAQFQQEVAFDGAEIGGNFFFRAENEQRVEFGGEARFLGIKVGGNAEFDGAWFKQEMAFDGAEIGGDFFFRPQGEQRVEFGGAARFLGVKVGGNAEFDGAWFKQEMAFDRAEIGASFFFRPAGEQRVEFGGEARFLGIKVGGHADFDEARFAKPAFFEAAVFSGSPFFREAEFSAPASFVNARFQLAAEFQGAQFQKLLDFSYARFEQEAHFAGAQFYDGLNLRDARMTTLSFQEAGKTAHFDKKSKVDLLGCSYDRLEIDGWRKLMDRQNEFSPRPWSHLEKTLRAAGHKAEADDVYYDRRKREGKQILFWKRPDRWVFDFMEQIGAGYGVRNWRVLAWIAIFLVFSASIFHMPGAVVRKQANTKPTAESVSTVSPVAKNPTTAETPPVRLRWDDAFAFSLKTFLPVEIPVARDWEPRPGWYSAWAAVLNLLGWILIPVALATVTGWMRRAHPD